MPNRNKLKNFIIFLTIFFGVLLFAKTSLAAVTLPWSCNFDSCTDWTQGQTLNCCGLNNGGGWTCSGQGEEINSRLAWGGTGKAQNHYAGAGDDVNSGGIILMLSPAREIWIRYYLRYEDGFSYGSLTYDKHLYINVGDYNGNAAIVCQPAWADEYRCAGAGDIGPRCTTGCGWASVFSDHQWHWIEIHLRYGSTDGIKEFWIDGKKVGSQTGIQVGDDTMRFERILIGSNQYNPNHSGCLAKVYDNLVVSTIGPIGPVSTGPDTTPPAAPTGVMVN